MLTLIRRLFEERCAYNKKYLKVFRKHALKLKRLFYPLHPSNEGKITASQTIYRSLKKIKQAL